MRTAALSLFLCWMGWSAQAACPIRAPGGAGISTCTVCPNGPLTFTLIPQAEGFFPPAILDPGYVVEPCDVIRWEFGDGSDAVNVMGLDHVTHDFETPGNYHVRATVTNALGSRVYDVSIVAATSPTRLAFSAPTYTVAEYGGAVQITVYRTFDMTRTVTATFATPAHSPTGDDLVPAVDGRTYALTFEPDETQKSFTIPIRDDTVYDGDRRYAVSLKVLTGGIYFTGSTEASIQVVEDDPQPTMSWSDVRIVEGDSGSTTGYIRVTLSAPLGHGLNIDSWIPPGEAATASADDYDQGGGVVRIAAGQTTGELPVVVYGDRRPEPDETFRFQWLPLNVRGEPKWDGRPALCTIVNDDYTLTPGELTVSTGAAATLHFEFGQPFSADTLLSFQSSAPDVATVAPVTARAGASSVEVTVEGLRSGLAQIRPLLPPGRVGTPGSALVAVTNAVPQIVSDPAALSVHEGDDVTITLSRFPAAGVATTLLLAANEPAIVDVPASATIPAGADVRISLHARRTGTAVVYVFTPDGAGTLIPFTVRGPIVTSLSPTTGSAVGSTLVTLYGEGFEGVCSVSFGGTSGFTWAPLRGMLSAQTRGGNPGPVDVAVTCNGERTVIHDGFTFLMPKRRGVR